MTVRNTFSVVLIPPLGKIYSMSLEYHTYIPTSIALAYKPLNSPDNSIILESAVEFIAAKLNQRRL